MLVPLAEIAPDLEIGGKPIAFYLDALDHAGIERPPSGRDWWRQQRRKADPALALQPAKPPSSRNACSSGVVSRPRIALRWGKRAEFPR